MTPFGGAPTFADNVEEVLHHRGREKILMAITVLDLYMDESHSGQPDSKVWVVGGLVGKTSAWKPFEEQLSEKLRKYDLETIGASDFFRVGDRGTRYGEYEKLTVDE